MWSKYISKCNSSWAINHCACWPQSKSCTSSPACLVGWVPQKKSLKSSCSRQMDEDICQFWALTILQSPLCMFFHQFFACAPFTTNLSAGFSASLKLWITPALRFQIFSSHKDQQTIPSRQMQIAWVELFIFSWQHLGSVALDFLGPALDIEAVPEPGIIGFHPLPPLWLVNSCSLA